MKSGIGEWNFQTINFEKALPISKKLGITVYTAQLLLNRGITTPEEALNFLNVPTKLITKSFDKLTAEAIGKRLLEAIKKKELITVHGDYDVDGVTGAAVLCQFLKSKGANFNYYLPDRFGDGYGLSLNTIEMLAGNETKVIITADCGISNDSEIKLANEYGIDVVVTDHHTLPEELPPAKYIFHPATVEDEGFHILSGVGTAFQLICDIDEMIPSQFEVPLEDYLDLVAMGTIADISPLKGINRSLVQYGVSMFRRTKRKGLLKLMELTGCKTENITPVDISFKIVPRLNAAGRMNKAVLALELLLAETDEEADKLARFLEELNRQRQELCEKMFQELEEIISNEINLDSDKAIVIAKEGLHHGVIGIICSRIAEKYSRPVFIMTIEGEISRGSGRSSNLHLVDALKSVSDLLVKYGGHKGAAGWTVKTENIDQFRKKILDFTNSVLTDNEMRPKINIEFEIPIDDINYQLFKEIQELAPFGESNPFPVIGTRNCLISEQILSKNGAHLFFNAKGEIKNLRTSFWNAAHLFPLKERIDMIFNIVENNWRNKISLELKASKVRNSATENENTFFKRFEPQINSEIEVTFPVLQLIKPEVYSGYILNFLGQHQVNFPEINELSEKYLKIFDYRNILNPFDELKQIIQKNDKISVSIFSENKIPFPEEIIHLLKEKDDRDRRSNEKHLVIWELPLKKEHLHHIINIIEADYIYMFFVNRDRSFDLLNSSQIHDVLKALYINNQSMNTFTSFCCNNLNLSKEQISLSLSVLCESNFIYMKDSRNYLNLLNKGINIFELKSYLDYVKEITQYSDFYNIMLKGSVGKIIKETGIKNL